MAINLQCYIMHREGTFEAQRFSGNQCKGRGHLAYDYHLCLIVRGGQESLDDNGFIVDHADLDSAIKTMNLTGSCEEMQLQVAKNMPSFLKERHIPCLGYRLVIKPKMIDGSKPVAFMEYIHVENNRYELLPMLMANN